MMEVCVCVLWYSFTGFSITTPVLHNIQHTTYHPPPTTRPHTTFPYTNSITPTYPSHHTHHSLPTPHTSHHTLTHSHTGEIHTYIGSWPGFAGMSAGGMYYMLFYSN